MMKRNLMVGATALFMGFVIPKGGSPERAVIGLFGILFLVALIRGFLHVRQGRGRRTGSG